MVTPCSLIDICYAMLAMLTGLEEPCCAYAVFADSQKKCLKLLFLR